jgi:hypothetical protein
VARDGKRRRSGVKAYAPHSLSRQWEGFRRSSSCLILGLLLLMGGDKYTQRSVCFSGKDLAGWVKRETELSVSVSDGDILRPDCLGVSRFGLRGGLYI